MDCAGLIMEAHMSGSLIKRFIDFSVKHTNSSSRSNILRTALYAANSVRNTPGSYTYDVHQRMSVDNILPGFEDAKLEHEYYLNEIITRSNVISVRILYPSGTAWNCIGSVYDELKKDNRYQVIVITEDYDAYIKVMKEKECDFIRLENYNIKDDKPDILILTSYSSTRRELNFDGMREYVKTVISLFPNIVINEFDADTHWKYVHRAYDFSEPDYYLFDSLVFNNCSDYIPSSKAVHMGNPQFDELYFRMQNANTDNPIWEKLSGKKVFLWATDHGLNEYYPIDALSIDLYMKEIIDFFSRHKDIGLIIRFHPYLIREMKQSGLFWNETEFNRIVNYCNSSPNIVWDNTPDYCSAFKLCDAMMIDANCGFTVSFLATGKPICRLLRDDIEVHLIHPELKECYYYANRFNECEQFIHNCLNGIDPLKNKRKEAFAYAVKNFDGKNGIRVKKFIDGLLGD